MNAESSSSLPTSRTVSSQPERAEITSNALTRQTHSGFPLSTSSQGILTRADAILGQEDISSDERHLRLEIVRAVMTGTVIRPSDDSPEMRNPAYWVLENDCFVVAPGIQPVEAIKSLGGIIVKVDRNNVPFDNHISEQYIENISEENIYSKLDNNYKKEDLYSQIDTLINLLNLDKN